MRTVLTGRVGNGIEYGEQTNYKGNKFRTAKFTLYVADPLSAKKNERDGKGDKWNDFPHQINAAGPIVDTIEKLEKAGELGTGKTVSVIGLLRVSEYEKDGKQERREYIQPEKFDTTMQLEKEHNALLKAFAKGDIDSLSKGLVAEFPSIEEAEEIDKATEYDVEQAQSEELGK